MRFFFSDYIGDLSRKELSLCCFHILCHSGEGWITYDGKKHRFEKDDLLVIACPESVTAMDLSEDLTCTLFAAPSRFLQWLLPSNNYSIGGSVSLFRDPVISLSPENAERMTADLARLKLRSVDKDFRFYREQMGSLCLSMMYDIFEFHAIQGGGEVTTDRAAFLLSELTRLLAEGNSKTERSVSWYAAQLHVTPKHFSAVVKRLTGLPVTAHIDRATMPIIRQYLNDERYSLTQIADLMNFKALSHFSRYCKHLFGMSPSVYRGSLQPKKP